MNNRGLWEHYVQRKAIYTNIYNKRWHLSLERAERVTYNSKTRQDYHHWFRYLIKKQKMLSLWKYDSLRIPFVVRSYLLQRFDVYLRVLGTSVHNYSTDQSIKQFCEIFPWISMRDAVWEMSDFTSLRWARLWVWRGSFQTN